MRICSLGLSIGWKRAGHQLIVHLWVEPDPMSVFCSLAIFEGSSDEVLPFGFPLDSLS